MGLWSHSSNPSTSGTLAAVVGSPGSHQIEPTNPLPMKTTLLLAAISVTALAGSALAGETPVAGKPAVPPPPPAPVFGTGWYFGLQAGVNAYQDFGGTRRTT